MGVGKRLRFEVFKRDGFRCVYCGATPMSSPLHVDHVVARANGGSDDPSNLVTACADCNLGKSAVPLERKQLVPVASDADKDHADQIREYMAIQREVMRTKDAIANEIREYWWERVNKQMLTTLYNQIPNILARHEVTDVMRAIEITGAKGLRSTLDQAKYFHGVLRKIQEAK